MPGTVPEVCLRCASALQGQLVPCSTLMVVKVDKGEAKVETLENCFLELQEEQRADDIDVRSCSATIASLIAHARRARQRRVFDMWCGFSHFGTDRPSSATA